MLGKMMSDPALFSRAEIEKAVEDGIVKAFSRLGLTIEEASHIGEVQRDFAFLRDFRVGTQSIQSKSVWLVMTIMVTAMCGFLWAGFKATHQN